jgi:hypothetical protein
VVAAVLIIALVIAIFAIDIGGRWWRETEWKRRWKRRRDDEEDD